MTRQMPNGKNARKFSAGRDRRTFLDPFLIGAARRRATWFKAPPAPKTTVARVVEHKDTTLPRSRAELQLGMYAAVQRAQNQPLPGTYEWAKAHAHESATAYVGLNLHRPSSSLNHGTAHFAGKPYHWTQTYDGVLRLAPGESPW